MKILALEKEVEGVTEDVCTPYLRAEAARAWELYQSGLLREIYFRDDWPGAVLMLECRSAEEASDILHTLPLVKEGLVAFDVIPLKAYPGFARLFAPVR
jgi:hypothetical protein